MEPHPIPKNLMDVEFKLFGSMTIKQFASLAANFVVALLIYIAEPPAIIKWPLVFAFIFLGVAFAFFKVNGTPFADWLISFIYAMLTPQRRVWKKSKRIPTELSGDFNIPKHQGNTDRKETIVDNIMNKNWEKVKPEPNLTEYEKKVFKNYDRFKSS